MSSFADIRTTAKLKLNATTIIIIDSRLDDLELCRMFNNLDLIVHLVIRGGHKDDQRALEALRELGPPIDITPPKDEITFLEGGSKVIGEGSLEGLRGYVRVCSMAAEEPETPVLILTTAPNRVGCVLTVAPFKDSGKKLVLRMDEEGHFSLFGTALKP